MDDRLDPRFAAAVRGALLAEVRGGIGSRVTALPPRRRRDLVLAGVIAAVAVIAIVIAGVSTAGVGRRTEPAGPVIRQPAQPFDGDCASMLSDADAAAVIGGRVVGLPAPDDVRRRLAGGLGCTWGPEKEGDGAIVLAAVSSDLRDASVPGRTCYGSDAGAGAQQTCTLDVVAGSTWISGTVTTETGVSAAATRTAAARLESLLDRDGDAVLPTRPSGAWKALSCMRLGRGADLAALLDRPALTVDPANGGSEVPASLVAAWDWTRSTRCLVQDPSDDAGWSFEIDAYPAGAWLEAQAEQSRADEITTGTAGVRLFANTFFGDEPGPSGRRAWIVSGPNAIVIDADGVPLTDAQLRSLAAALVKTLDAAR